MRMLIFMLVLAIGFSGFSAAAHAFDSAGCGKTFSIEKADETQNNCVNHFKTDSKNDKNPNNSDHTCVSCGHCCMSHAAITQYGIHIVIPTHKMAFSHVNDQSDDDFISGLKRPPRILV